MRFLAAIMHAFLCNFDTDTLRVVKFYFVKIQTIKAGKVVTEIMLKQ
jgi:hypothetical protein